MDYADALGAIDELKLRDAAKQLLIGDVARDIFHLS
jgi:hypothetical protein